MRARLQELMGDIDAEEEKLDVLQKGYEDIKDKVVCKKVPKLKELIEEATRDCLKDCESNTDTSRFRAKMTALFNRKDNFSETKTCESHKRDVSEALQSETK